MFQRNVTNNFLCLNISISYTFIVVLRIEYILHIVDALHFSWLLFKRHTQCFPKRFRLVIDFDSSRFRSIQKIYLLGLYGKMFFNIIYILFNFECGFLKSYNWYSWLQNTQIFWNLMYIILIMPFLTCLSKRMLCEWIKFSAYINFYIYVCIFLHVTE